MAEKVIITVDFEESLYHEIEQIAKDLNISMDQLFTEMIQEFLDRYESRKMVDPQDIIDKINEVYADESVQNETLELTKRMRPIIRDLFQDTW